MRHFVGVEMMKMTKILLLIFLISFLGMPKVHSGDVSESIASGKITADSLPEWNGTPYVEVNGGIPAFSEKQKESTTDYTKYSPLDDLGRAGYSIGCLGKKTLNDGGRESIGQVRPVGWETKKYAHLIEDRYVYNRCHLLMNAAAAGMDSETCNSTRNLITGTRYMNADGMLPYESELLSYLRSTKNHVLYRVTPIYKGKELVARGVQMEAWSVEDGGRGLKFNVFCYNMQPGISIDYVTGKTHEKADARVEVEKALAQGATTVAHITANSPANNTTSEIKTKDAANGSAADNAADGSREVSTEIYVLNTNTKRFHYPNCPSVNQMFDKNKEVGHFSREELIRQGYIPCGNCRP